MKNATLTRDVRIRRVTLLGSFVNLILLILKFVAGIVGRSGAMIADAVHSLTDFVTDIIVLVFVGISSKPRDKDHDYGHGKYETLATVVIGAMLVFVGIGILVKSVGKIISIMKGEAVESPEMIAFVAALVSIVFKELLFRVTRKVAREVNSPATEANAWHHRSDAMSSIGTSIGIGAAVLLGNKWIILDPVAALIVSFFIIKAAIQLIVPGMNDLLEKSLPDEIEDEIISIISENPEISDPHNLRTRRIGAYFAVEVHIRLNEDMTVSESHAITKEIERKIKDRFGDDIHIIVHVEPKPAE